MSEWKKEGESTLLQRVIAMIIFIIMVFVVLWAFFKAADKEATRQSTPRGVAMYSWTDPSGNLNCEVWEGRFKQATCDEYVANQLKRGSIDSLEKMRRIKGPPPQE